ncbi:MAG: DUF2804 domain-containing protein [Spirochaetota bacterium]|nr:DUF2804 domain-containing protein [Spirochaetota bacterium]OPZ34964.1 MAG: hypothetical protein BWY96_02952 [Spirochaetes bacterium ADurb.BinA120]HPI15849.1 DUF2804 domain-containing protein [Spirochaetota bacterium]
MAQHEITKPVELLDERGHIIEEGWARRLYWRYDRERIKAPWFRIKEWDYYYVLSHKGGYGVCVTMSDLGYAGLFAIAWIDLKNRATAQVDTMSILPRGKTGFSPTSESGDVGFSDKKLSISYRLEGNERVISLECPGFEYPKGERGLSGQIRLKRDPNMDSMCIATSWKENRRAFYLNQKINCMPAGGSVKIGKNEYGFDPADSFGGLDWGRGNWTYKNRWYWGSASGALDGLPFGWNIGYGFSDRTPASENMIFHGNRAHKLEDVVFHIDTSNYTAPWRFSSSDGRFEMTMEPAVDRSSSVNLGIIKSVQHQVFGYFSGQVILDDGKKVKVERFPGFAEDVLNWY